MKKIFILDDDHDIIEVLKRILGLNYHIHFKTDAIDIAEEIIEFKPDLILLDNFIGEKNAAEVVNVLKQRVNPFAVPIVLFSAAYNIATVAQILGAYGYLEKPSSINQIRSYIKNIISV